MADDEDWLALQIAASQSPFKTFQRPGNPFEAPDPGPDTVYTTHDVNNIQAYQGRSNPLKSAFGWLKGMLRGHSGLRSRHVLCRESEGRQYVELRGLS